MTEIFAKAIETVIAFARGVISAIVLIAIPAGVVGRVTLSARFSILLILALLSIIGCSSHSSTYGCASCQSNKGADIATTRPARNTTNGGTYN